MFLKYCWYVVKLVLNMKCKFVQQSETAVVLIPELDVEVYCCSMGGKFTTLEGLLHDIKQEVQQCTEM